MDNNNSNSKKSHGDCISNLPDHIISSILSHLPTKDAVRTSVLSHYWKHNWTSIYNIDIRDDGHKEVTRFIDDILFAYKSRLISFHLLCERAYDDDEQHRLVKWISNVLSRNVQILMIQVNVCGRVDLPVCLSSSTSLTELNLFFNCTLKIPNPNCFQNLKTLALHNANIHNEQSLYKSPLLLSFPVLEDLELNRCTWSNASFVEIRAPALVRFEAHSVIYSLDGDGQIKIRGPKLKFINVVGFVALFDICAPTVSEVTLVDIVTLGVYGSRPYETLKSFCYLSTLVMSGSVLKAFVQFKPATPPIFRCLKTLNLCSMVEMRDLMEFLQLTPILEELFIWDACGGVEQVKPLPACMVFSLKKVKFACFSGTPAHVAIGKFFGENAKALERFIIPDSETRHWMA